MPSSRGCRSSYDCIVKIKGVTTRPILFSQLMRSDGEGAMNPEELFTDDCTPVSEQERVHEDEWSRVLAPATTTRASATAATACPKTPNSCWRTARTCRKTRLGLSSTPIACVVDEVLQMVWGKVYEGEKKPVVGVYRLTMKSNSDDLTDVADKVCTRDLFKRD